MKKNGNQKPNRIIWLAPCFNVLERSYSLMPLYTIPNNIQIQKKFNWKWVQLFCFVFFSLIWSGYICGCTNFLLIKKQIQRNRERGRKKEWKNSFNVWLFQIDFFFVVVLFCSDPKTLQFFYHRFIDSMNKIDHIIWFIRKQSARPEK